MIAADRKHRIVKEAMNERRRFRRIRLSYDGRAFLPTTSEEAPCTIEDISAGGASITGRFKQKPTGKAIIYIRSLGQLEGRVMSVTKNGFTMIFSCSRKRRDKLVDTLTVEMNRHVLNGSASRSRGNPSSK